MVVKPRRLAGLRLIVIFGLALFSVGGMPVALAGVNAWTTSWPLASLAGTLAPDPSGRSSVYAGAFGPILFDLKGNDWIDIANGTGSAYPDLNAIAVDPQDSRTVYVAVSSFGLPPGTYVPQVRGGIYKSTDGGETWRFIDVHQTDPVISVVVDPLNEGTVYALATVCTCTATPLYCSKFGESCSASAYKSTDSGATWSRLGALAYVSALVIDPIVPSTLFVTADGGVFKSLDGGSTWTARNSGFGSHCSALKGLTISQTNSSVLFVATGEACPVAAYKTTDGGSTWKPTALATAEVGDSTSIVVDPTNEKVVYLTGRAVTEKSGGLFRSVDGGESWSHFDEGLPGRNIAPANIGPAVIERDGATIHVLVGERIFDYNYVPPLRSPVRAVSGTPRVTSVSPR